MDLLSNTIDYIDLFQAIQVVQKKSNNQNGSHKLQKVRIFTETPDLSN